jgi:aconitate hydratase
MGVLPLEFLPGENRESLGLKGSEKIDITGLAEGITPRKKVAVRAEDAEGGVKMFTAVTRIDTPEEVEYYRHGGILPFVLRKMV